MYVCQFLQIHLQPKKQVLKLFSQAHRHKHCCLDCANIKTLTHAHHMWEHTRTAAVDLRIRILCFPSPVPTHTHKFPFMLSSAPDWEFGSPYGSALLCEFHRHTFICTLSHPYTWAKYKLTYTVYACAMTKHTHPRKSLHTLPSFVHFLLFSGISLESALPLICLIAQKHKPQNHEDLFIFGFSLTCNLTLMINMSH